MLGSIYNSDNPNRAISFYKKAIKFNRRYYNAFLGLGNCYLKLKNYILANKYYSEAININPIRYTLIYKNRAIARIQLNDKIGAKSDLNIYLKQMNHIDDASIVQDILKELD